jgi:hypothetical protein
MVTNEKKRQKSVASIAPTAAEDAERLRAHLNKVLGPHMNKAFEELYVRVAYRRYWLSNNPNEHAEHIAMFADVTTRIIEICKKQLVDMVGDSFYSDVAGHLSELEEAMKNGCSFPHAELLASAALAWLFDTVLCKLDPDVEIDTMQGWHDAFKTNPHGTSEAFDDFTPYLAALMGNAFAADFTRELFGFGYSIVADFDTDTDEQQVETARKRRAFLAKEAELS